MDFPDVHSGFQGPDGFQYLKRFQVMNRLGFLVIPQANVISGQA